MIVFDLDGTLALDHHRRHHIEGTERSNAHWAAYFAACGGDEPHWPICDLLDKLLWNGEEVEVWSGRSHSAMATTGLWFKTVFDGKRTNWKAESVRDLPYHALGPKIEGLELQDGVTGIKLRVQMRSQPDRTADDEMKRGWLRAARESGRPVSLAFEDRQRVVDMWRGEGVVCCQVAPGHF